MAAILTTKEDAQGVEENIDPKILKMKADFENESTFWKWKHILKMKEHFENESTVW